MGMFSSRLIHWGPLLALGIIATIAYWGLVCLLQWWPPFNSIWGLLHMCVYLSWIVIILYNFFNAVFIGPGHVPDNWKPSDKSDLQYLQACKVCQTYKAPRSHHCRKCERCVLKMDHHCPWINNCVGFRNHCSFTSFVFFAPIGCIHAAVVLFSSMYWAMYRNYYFHYGGGSEPNVYLTVNQFVCCMFSVGLAIGVTVAVGCLFYIQIKSILKNETGIESWIVEKAKYLIRQNDEEKFVFPYDLGMKQNLLFVFGFQSPKYNGIYWPVVKGCHQYSLTVEQLKQKKEKQERCVTYHVTTAFSGQLIPCTHGLRVVCSPPCTDEPRIKLEPGDSVLVSRWRKHWLYGDICNISSTSNKKEKRRRGWFPRRCAVEESSTSDEKKEN